EGVATPGVRSLAEAETGENVGATDHGIDRHPVAETLAEGDEIGFDPILAVGIHRSGAPEIGLHFVEEKENVVLLTELRQHLHVFLLRVIGPAATEIGFGDENAEAVAEFGLERLEFGAVGREVDGFAAALQGLALLFGKADETDAGIALLVRLAAGDRARKTFFAVESVAGRKDDAVALGTLGQ